MVALAFSFQFLGDFLLEDERLEGVVALFLGSRETESEASGIVLLLVDKRGESAVLALVILDLDFEFGRFLRELFGECLEFEEL